MCRGVPNSLSILNDVLLDILNDDVSAQAGWHFICRRYGERVLKENLQDKYIVPRSCRASAIEVGAAQMSFLPSRPTKKISFLRLLPCLPPSLTGFRCFKALWLTRLLEDIAETPCGSLLFASDAWTTTLHGILILDTPRKFGAVLLPGSLVYTWICRHGTTCK